jgi:hypothetical protein
VCAEGRLIAVRNKIVWDLCSSIYLQIISYLWGYSILTNIKRNIWYFGRQNDNFCKCCEMVVVADSKLTKQPFNIFRTIGKASISLSNYDSYRILLKWPNIWCVNAVETNSRHSSHTRQSYSIKIINSKLWPLTDLGWHAILRHFVAVWVTTLLTHPQYSEIF